MRNPAWDTWSRLSSLRRYDTGVPPVNILVLFNGPLFNVVVMLKYLYIVLH